ncbi:MAG: glycosyltransferase family 39 protein [Oscillochloridaceae bacterium]|nr:glycosyltransferase family 39 protein [Chloroflexaceae bacterium]MDW8389316.1 glycosyltransferase family 39 protein [Oscillochloridaceae bacterium]
MTIALIGQTLLRWLLPLALIHGLLYLLMVPPWQHYDEPSHFEYAMQIALGEGAAPGGKSVQLSHEIADSMYRHRFWPPGVRPDLLGPEPAPVGENQRIHPPLYYTLIAFPLHQIRYLAVEAQLYLARAISVLFYTLTVLAAWRIAVTVTPDEPALQIALPLLVLLTPTFADLMTAVNNDVLVNMAATAAILGTVQLIRDGPRPSALALAVLGLIVAVLAKRIGLVLVPLIGFALLSSLHRRPVRRRLVAGIGLVMLAVAGIAAFRPVTVEGPSGPHLVLAARSWLAALDAAYLRLDIDNWIRSVSDPDLIGERYRYLIYVAFTSFWARFSWGQASAGPVWDWVFAFLALAAMLGLARGFLTARRALPLWQQRCMWLFFGAVTLGWMALFARLHPLPPLEFEVYIPRGRYMFWAIVPTLWLLLVGLRLLLPAGWRIAGTWLLVALFVIFDLVALVTIATTLR